MKKLPRYSLLVCLDNMHHQGYFIAYLIYIMKHLHGQITNYSAYINLIIY